jgi:hypothetical protein
MIRETSCLAVLCLLLAGCTGLGGSSRGAGAGWKLIPSRLGSPSNKQSFIEAVNNDPFPKAGQADVRL